jgi:lysozyme
MKNGIDVSYAQGHIDWTKVKTDFVYIKANEGVGFKDKMVNDNSVGAHKAGIPFGFYHFVTLNQVDVVTDAKQEAADFVSTMDMLPKYSPDLIPVLDIEQENKLQISPQNINLWINVFVDELAKAGHKVMLYSYTPWLNANLPKDHDLGRLPLWIAQYTGKPVPVLPFGWSDYKAWQYSNAGKIDGIYASVDLNRMK